MKSKEALCQWEAEVSSEQGGCGPRAGRRDLPTNLMRKWRRGWGSLPGMGLWDERATQQKRKSAEGG